MQVEDKLRLIREGMRLTQSQMSDLLGLNRSYLSELESGRRPVQPWVIQRAEDVEKRWRTTYQALHAVQGGDQAYLDVFSAWLPSAGVEDVLSSFEYIADRRSEGPISLQPLYLYANRLVMAELAKRLHLDFSLSGKTSREKSKVPEALENKSTSLLTESSINRRTGDVKIRTFDELLTALRAKTCQRGGMARLAEALNVQQARVSEWLSGKTMPGGQTTLRLLHWIEQQERKQTTLGGSIKTTKGKT
jgi:transcriptional regulator with XRE-family HTH domain